MYIAAWKAAKYRVRKISVKLQSVEILPYEWNDLGVTSS